MLNNEILLELFKRYVQYETETIVQVKAWDTSVGVVVETDGRFLSIRDDNDFLLIGRAPWVDSVVVVEREDVFTHGEHETDAIVVANDARSYHLNEPDTVAGDLGHRVFTDLDADAYAQILVTYHPWSVARRELVVGSDHLSERLGITDGPDVKPLEKVEDDDALALLFFSTTVYAPLLGAPLLCDVYQWRVDISHDGRAEWGRRLVAEQLNVPVPAR